MDQPLILPLDSNLATLSNAGGKGMNLARLMRQGFAVPEGFLVTTAAYRQFVAANNLQPWLEEQLAAARMDDPAALEELASSIRGAFRQGVIPAGLVAAVREAYGRLGGGAVAVRSSATAEDLPETSFAGQQDSYLNVNGSEAVLEAVRECWGGLWTARAIGYRARNEIDHREVSMAVVMQEMVSSEVSGVLFTANPLTGRRTETVIDATWGLGEALVAGLVEPDQYVVETATSRILHKQLGAKALLIRGRTDGGTETVAPDREAEQALPDAVIRELVELGAQVAAHFGEPQDIEWAWAGGRLYLLQSRPITSLFPLPENSSPARPELYFSFGAAQGMLEPMTPLGRDTLANIFSGLGRRLLGFPVNLANQRVALTAAERFWINVSPLARNRLGQRLIRRVLPVIEGGGAGHLPTILAQEGFSRGGWPRPVTTWRVLKLVLPLVWAVLRVQLRPEVERQRLTDRAGSSMAHFSAEAEAAGSWSERLALYDAAPVAFASGVIRGYVPLLLSGMGSMALLHRLARRVPGGDTLVLAATRGLPHNVTTEMDLALWETAQQIKGDPAGAICFENESAPDLAASYLAGELPAQTQAAVRTFLERYGMRGVAEIDMGRPRWREEPAHIMQVLQNYLEIEDAERAPDAVFGRGRAAAQDALDELLAKMRRTRLGWLKSRVARAAGRRMRLFAGYRESPKFFAIQLFGLLREAMLDAGRELATEGVLERPEDVFFLHLPELKTLAGGRREGWQRIVEERRNNYEREQRRVRLPRLILSDGTTYYEGIVGEDGDLAGTPVSPGVVEGPVRVVLDPQNAQLAPGDILVCPGTDPAWTPLFLAAGGLITEVGGLMTHGSVVAREYGIPAVVGVHQATSRLETGQQIRLDGSSGRITLL